MAFSYKDIISEAQSYFINGYMAILLFALFYDVFYLITGSLFFYTHSCDNKICFTKKKNNNEKWKEWS